jgi:tetratricopeptide (TPR) repeat protein
VRVVAQLIDAQTGAHIWAERYDRALEDVFTVQDEITSAVVTAIVPAVADAELGRILRKPLEGLGAWEAYQRGLWHFARVNIADNERAKELFRRAVAIDPSFAPAYTQLARVILDSAATYGTRSRMEASQEATEWAQRAVALDQEDAEAQATLAASMFMGGNRPAGRERVSLAVAIDPNSSGANFHQGAALIADGRHSEGRIFILKAIRLDPRGPQSAKYLSLLAASYYFERDYVSTIEVARRSVVRYPGYARAYRWLAAALGQLGQVDEAHGALEELIKFASSMRFVADPGVWVQEDHAHLLDGLRKAGWQG